MELSLLGGGRAEPTREPVLEPDPAQLVWQSSLQTSENQEPEPEQVQLSRHASGLVSERNPPSTSACTSPSFERVEGRGVTKTREINPLGGAFVAPVADASGEGPIGAPRSVILVVDAIEQPGRARLEDRGVRGAILCSSGDRTRTQIDLPLSFANIEREDATLSITVHKDVHPDCELGGQLVALTCTEGATVAEAWEHEMKQLIQKANTKHWGTSKSFIREQRDSWVAEGKRCKGMSVAEYFVDIGLGHVYVDTWSWCAGVLEGLEAKEGKSVADVKEIAYYRRKVEMTEVYEDMELTDYMNILKHQDLVPAKRRVSYADFIHAEVDGTGRRKVSEATVFVSHVWKMATKDFFEVCLAEMAEEDYAWIDLYLHNQYQGKISEIGDENSEYWVTKFSELIGSIGKVIAIVTDWESPTMLRRIWCLFELNAAIDTGAELRFVASSAQRMDLMLNLQEKFKYLNAIVQNIEVRDCDAKRPHEIQDKAVFLSRLAGIEDEVNDKLSEAMQRWLTESAQGVLARSDPSREPLGPAEMELEVAAIGEGRGCCCCVSGAKATRLVERRPRLPMLLVLPGLFGMLAMMLIMVVGLFGTEGGRRKAEGDAGGRFMEVLRWMGLVCLLSLVMLVVGGALDEHQRERALRPAPPLLGAWVVRHRRAVVGVVGLLSGAGVPLALRFAVPWSAENEASGLAQFLSFFTGPLLAAGLTVIVWAWLDSDADAAERRASLAVSAGWLRLRLGGEQQQLEEAERIFRTAHEQLQRLLGPDDPVRSLLAAPGLARSRCELGRTAEAQAVVAEVQAAVERGGQGNRCTAPAARWHTKHPQAVQVGVGLLGWCVGTLLCWWLLREDDHGGAAAKFIFSLIVGLFVGFVGLLLGWILAATINSAFAPLIEWQQRGALWRARAAAATKAPDAEVLALLTEAARTKFGKRYPLGEQEPELTDLLRRMAAVDDAERPSTEGNDRTAWLALPPLMRSVGGNALSPWVKYTHEGKSYYKRVEPLDTSLAAPSEGVQQEAEIGMPGLSMLGEGRWEKLPGLSWGKGRWESEYFDLEGPGRWSAQRQKAYRRKMLATKLGWGAFFTGILPALFCWAFVYADCGEHGSWGIGECHCTDGYKGDRCDVCQCDSCHCPALPIGMAMAYVVLGATDEECNGRYDRLSAECNGKPVYQQQQAGLLGLVLFQPTGESWWAVTTSNDAANYGCASIGVITSHGNGGVCPASPDGSGCEGRWRETTHDCGEGRSWCNVPSLAVARWCPDDNPCCGIDCGVHGTLVGGGNGAGSGMASCSCRCRDGYTGDRCAMGPLPVGMAEAYVVSGAADEKYAGRYDRLSAECNGKPVYQQQQDGLSGYVLFQPTGELDWMVSVSDHAASCASSGVIRSNGNGGVCPASPDGSGCEGRWQEATDNCREGSGWCNVPSLAVDHWCPDDNPCCGIDCGEHGTLVGGGNGAGSGMASCSCRCRDGYTGDRCAMGPLPVGMAEAYVVSGAADEKYDGQYDRLSAECNGKPVYQLQAGLSGYVLFQPTGHSYWMGGTSDHATSCANDGHITSSGNGGVCPVSPDGSGCKGRWQERGGSEFQNALSLAVVARRCPADKPCCGIDCGDHGSLAGGDGSSESCGCTCADGYAGNRCQLPPDNSTTPAPIVLPLDVYWFLYYICGQPIVLCVYCATRKKSSQGKEENCPTIGLIIVGGTCICCAPCVCRMLCAGTKPLFKKKQEILTPQVPVQPTMRSGGSNALSPWVEYTHTEGRCYYKRTDPLELTLALPSEGVRQEATIGLPGVTLLGESWWEKLPGMGWGEDKWESEYAALGGSGCWTAEQNRRYRRTVAAKKIGWVLLFGGILCALFCWMFVYLDCGEHGGWGVGSCNCVDGFAGDRCDVCNCAICLLCPALPAGMAEAYTISGAARDHFNGRYERLAAECNDKPVYQLDGSGGYVLFQPTGRACWFVISESDLDCSPLGAVGSCEMVSPSNGHGGMCATSPDGDGCVGTWQENTHECGDGISWCVTATLTVTRE